MTADNISAVCRDNSYRSTTKVTRKNPERLSQLPSHNHCSPRRPPLTTITQRGTLWELCWRPSNGGLSAKTPDPSVALLGPHILARPLVKAPSLRASANTCRPVALQVCRRSTNRSHLATVFDTSASVKDARRRWSGLANLFLLVSVKTAGVARCW